jgi:hypothetical protein
VIIVQAQLESAISSSRDELLCEVHIANDGTGSGSRGNYDVELYSRGGGRLVRRGRVENWPRNAKPAWRLIQAAMESLG